MAKLRLTFVVVVAASVAMPAAAANRAANACYRVSEASVGSGARHRQGIGLIRLVQNLNTEPLETDAVPDPLFDDLDAEFDAIPSGYPDPFESTNRHILAFNGVVDDWLLDPVTDLYAKVFPKPVKKAVARAIANISSLSTFANDILQGHPKLAGVTLARLAMNSTVGIAGLFDPAKRVGLDSHHADLGQTMAYAGIGSGPYLIVPVLGPTTTRGLVSTVTEGVVNPISYWFGPLSTQTIAYGGTSGISLREIHLIALKNLKSSIDYYAALRNGYYQTRQNQLWHGQPEPPRPVRHCRAIIPQMRWQPWRIPHTCRVYPLGRAGEA